MRPVSYTHLEVYKRQGKIGSYMATNGLNMNFGPTADIAYGDNADNDTYAFGSESATVGDCCLLYTSTG